MNKHVRKTCRVRLAQGDVMGASVATLQAWLDSHVVSHTPERIQEVDPP